MTVTQILKHVESGLQDWAVGKGGTCEVAFGPAHLFALLQQKPGGIKLCVMLASQEKRGEFEEASMVDDSFIVVAHRQQGMKLRKGDNLTRGSAGGEPFFDLLEELRDVVRGLDFDPTDTEWTADYKGMRPYNWPWAEQQIDAWQLEFSLGQLMPSPVMAKLKALLSANVNLPDDSGVNLTFDTEVYDTAEAYNPSTGTFTAPATGYYLCEVRLGTDIDPAANWTFGFKVNGETGDGTEYVVTGPSAFISTVLKLEAGDTVRPHATQATGDVKAVTAGASWFKIHRI